MLPNKANSEVEVARIFEVNSGALMNRSITMRILYALSAILMLHAVVFPTTAFAVSNEINTAQEGSNLEARTSGLERITDKPVKGISEYRLKSNGMKVLLIENHAAPVVATTIVYHVGSRNEAVGYTGATHFLEHMMFKGTSRFDPKQKNGIDDLLKRVGGINNATTWFDRTNYFEVVPARYLSLCLDIESDRLRNLLLRAEDREAEMTVVRNELERGEDDPDELLETNLFATAFREHPYHHPTIGWRSDVEGVPLARLKQFYDDFYWPDNATLIVSGDFDSKEAIEMIDERFSSIPKSPAPFPQVYTEEPPQEGERRFTVRRGTDVPRLVIGYHIPRCLSDDTYALDVLENVLGDSGRKSSRLYKKLIGTGLASFVDASNYSLRDPGLFVLSAQTAGANKLERLEEALDKQARRLTEKPISEEELKKAKSAITKSIRLSIADPLGFSMYLTEAIAVADWRWWLDYPEKIEKVTADDVMAVAKKYFLDDNKTVGYYYPRQDGGKAAPPPIDLAGEKKDKDKKQEKKEASTSAVVKKEKIEAEAGKGKVEIASKVKRSTLDNGLTVLSLAIPDATTVAVSGKIKNGPSDFYQVPVMVSTLMTSGSSRYSKEALADELELMGADIDFDPDTFWTEFDSHVVKEDLSHFVEVLANVIQEPLFSGKELKLETKLRETSLKESMADTNEVSWNLMTRALYREGSPFYQKSFKEQLKELDKIKISDLKDYHRNNFTAGNTVIAFVGAVEHDSIVELCKKQFGSWARGEGKGWQSSEDDLVKLEEGNKIVSRSIPDKANVDVRIGKHLPVSFSSSDYFATVVANAALGYDSFACRLAPVRDKYGLTYGIYSVIDDPTQKYSPWYIKYSVNPNNLEKARKIVQEIVADYVKDGITDEELTTEKSHLSGTYEVYLRSPSKIAERLSLYEAAGVDLSYIDNYASNISRVTKDQVNKAIEAYFDISKESVTAMSGTLKSEEQNKDNKKEK